MSRLLVVAFPISILFIISIDIKIKTGAVRGAEARLRGLRECGVGTWPMEGPGRVCSRGCSWCGGQASGTAGMWGSQGDVGGCAELGRSGRDGLSGCGDTRRPPQEPGVCSESNGKSQIRCAPRGPGQGWTQRSGEEKLMGRFHKQGPPAPTSEQVTVWLVEILFR